jgi:tetratricopeptide (TPR) repeat protein
MKGYCENHLNYALMDKQINSLNIALDKYWKDYNHRSSIYRLIRKEILTKKPDETDHLMLDGIRCREENKQDSAYLYFKKAVDKDPARLNNYFCVIMDELQFNRDTVKALEYINKVISISNGVPISTFQPYQIRSWIYSSRKQYEIAYEDINRVLEKDTNNQQALYFRGYIKSEMKDFAGSLSDYQLLLKWLRNKPFPVVVDSASIFNSIGWNYYLMKEYELCLEYADKSLLLKPDIPDVLDTKGSGYFGLGDYEKCIDFMSQAIVLNPYLANSLYLRGLSYLKLNKRDLAYTDLSEAAELGVAEAEEALKGLGLSASSNGVENQRKFPIKKSKYIKNRLTMDAYGIYYRLN